jgi:hypothetical protein
MLAPAIPAAPASTPRRETFELRIALASADRGFLGELAMVMGSFLFSGTRDGCAGLIMEPIAPHGQTILR